MGILRMGFAALAVGGMVMVAERNAGETVTPIASSTDAAGQVLGFCLKQPELCASAAGAGLAAIGAGAASTTVPPSAPAVPTATPPAPRLTTASIPTETPTRRAATSRLVPASVPLPPRRPGTRP